MSLQALKRLRLLKRPKCVLLGCATDDLPCCARCGADLYDYEFLQSGWLDPVFRLTSKVLRLIRKLGPKKCRQCGKKYRRGYDEYLCSSECFDNYLPF